MLTGSPLRMPKNNQKCKRREATAQSDDAFDDMLAELRAADLAALAANSSSSSSSSSSNSNSSSIATTASSSTSTVSLTAKAIKVSEERNIKAVMGDDIAQLRHWARQGLRVTSALPLVHAVLLGKLGIAQCLVQELGADVNEANGEGYTPLYVAAGKGDLAMVRCLVKELGADINKTNNEGDTPLFIAAQLGNLATVRVLVKELGADINHAIKIGRTPLMAASVRKRADVVKWLIKAGADTQISMRSDDSDDVSTGCTPANLSRYVGAYLPIRPHTWRPRRTARALVAAVRAS
jgi:ankyrin repeat protein